MEDKVQFQISPDILLKAMRGEQDAVVYYGQLMEMTSDEQDIKMIKGIRNDEIKHLNAFGDLYVQITGQKPNLPRSQMPHIHSFADGAERSILDELEAYEFYRDVYLANSNPQVRNAFFEAMTDENEHAAKYNYMFTKSLSHKG